MTLSEAIFLGAVGGLAIPAIGTGALSLAYRLSWHVGEVAAIGGLAAAGAAIGAVLHLGFGGG